MAKTKRMTLAGALSRPELFQTQWIVHASPEEIKQVKAAYTALRDVGQKRIGQLAGSEFKGSKIMKYHKDPFPTLKELKTPAQLANAIRNLRDFVGSSESTIGGQRKIRKEQIATLQERGYGFVNASNLRDFGEFMDWLRDKGAGYSYEGVDVATDSAIIYVKGAGTMKMEEAFKLWLASGKTEIRLEEEETTERGS